VFPSGGKLWRVKYRFNKKEKRLALGAYPEVALKEAREKRDDARRLRSPQGRFLTPETRDATPLRHRCAILCPKEVSW
jgi:hypothetical protein